MSHPYDSILIVSFGGPDRIEDVIPFLENVTRGRAVPRERLLAVAEHYYHFQGISPINAQNLALIAALRNRLAEAGPQLPIYFGNRNWKPYLTDALSDMARDGKKHALAFFTSLFSSYSGCRQYRENIAAAREAVGPNAPIVDKLRMGFNHPGFISATCARVTDSLSRIPRERRERAKLLFTAHSIPLSMSEHSSYTTQLHESSRLVAAQLGYSTFELCYQSRSGSPAVQWLEPDINDAIRTIASGGAADIMVVPIGFVSDHLEVLYDLDIEAARTARESGVNLVRACAVGTHPDFVEMIRDLIVERIENRMERPACGTLGAWHDVCPEDCCLIGPRKTGCVSSRNTARCDM